MQIVGDYDEVSEVFAAHFPAEPETPVRINVHLEPHEMPVPVENEYDDIENENDDNESDDRENENDDSENENDDSHNIRKQDLIMTKQSFSLLVLA